ncbi:MAG: LamG-like jellyroll fold domain-containing protein [Saprospiraceae bacterium]
MIRILQILLLLASTNFMFAQNNGIQFDGSDDELVLCNSADFNIGATFTIEAWIFTPQWKAESWQGSIVTKDMQGPDSGFAFRAGKNGTLSFVMSADGIWNEVLTDQIMNTNQWYHVAAVVKDGTMALFINGESVTTGILTGTPINNGQSVHIGASAGFGGRGWNGVIDEVRIWNTARTGQELFDNQTAEFTGTEAGLVAYLPMNEGSTLTTANLVDGSCNGTFGNMTEDAWVDGFSIPSFDVGVVSVDAPDVLNIYARPVKPSVTIQNYGSDPITNIPVKLDVNGIPTLEETFTGTISPGESVVFTFQQPLDLTENNTNLLNAKTDHPDDTNGLNNSKSYRYKKPDDGTGMIISILNNEQHNFGSAGQTKFTPVNLPKNSEDYEQVLLHFSVECPTTGCDPWDQPASFFIETPGGSYELARFVTPYGIGCGPWTVDVTDFKSVMKGAVIFKSFVQVWGASGWLVDAELEFIKGANPKFQKVNRLWETNYWVYGDPAIDYDLPTQNVAIDNSTATSHMRMTITGHGQGNTNNAAEFSNQTHDVVVGGATVTTHNLWKDNCDQNACTGQLGNETSSRAGWCPGQNVIPYVYNMTGNITPGASVSVDYVLEDYVNLLNTGYNNNGHTEPHYKIFAYLVEESGTRYGDYNNLRAESVSVTVSGTTANPSFDAVSFDIKNTGTMDMTNVKVSYYVNENFVVEETINGTIAVGDTYTYNFNEVSGFTAGDDNLVFAVVSVTNDEDISDDVTKVVVDPTITSTNEIPASALKLFPNPSARDFHLELTAELLNGQAEIMDAQGKLVRSFTITNLNSTITLTEKGLYLLTIQSTEGKTITRKFVVQ